MDESRDPSDSCDLSRTAPLPTIIHYPVSRTQNLPDSVFPVVEVNRSRRSHRRGHGLGNDLALNNVVPINYQPQAAACQQRPPSIDISIRRSNTVNQLWDVNGVEDKAIASPPPVIHHGGLAEQRQGRSPPPAGHKTELPSSRSKYVFVMEDGSDLAHPSKRVQTDDEKRNKRQLRQQLKEKGGACLHCSQERKGCDREDDCSRCRLPTGEATICFRGSDKLWLWRAVEQHSLDVGSRERALRRARETTFADDCQRLVKLQALPRNNMSLAVCLTSKLDDSTATSRIVTSSGSLAEILKSRPSDLTEQVERALATHLPDLVLPSLPNVLTSDRRDLMAAAQSAFRVYRFLSNAAHIKYHASPWHLNSVLEVSCFLMEYCARMLATEVEKVLEHIRAMIWPKNAGDDAKHAFGLYYCILEGLRQWNTRNVIDDVLKPLISRASVVVPDLSLLYRDIYGSGESLRDFVTREIPRMTDIHNLHMSHELLSAVHIPPKPWDPMPNDFHKDGLVHDFLMPGRVGWMPELHPVQSGVLSPRPILTSCRQKARFEASESCSSELLHESPDRTLRNSSWDDRSTYIQSPTEAGHGDELRHQNQVPVGDVNIPEDLLGITGGTGTRLKRGRALASPHSTSPSPPAKQSKSDVGQACLGYSEYHPDDADFVEAIAPSGPQPWDKSWDQMFDCACHLPADNCAASPP